MEFGQISLGAASEGSGLDKNRKVNRRRWSSTEMDAATTMISELGMITHHQTTDFCEHVLVAVTSSPPPSSPFPSSPSCSPVNENSSSSQEWQDESSRSSATDLSVAEPQPEVRPPPLSPSSWIYLTPRENDDALQNSDLLNPKLKKSTVALFCVYCSQPGHRMTTCPELGSVPLPCCRALDFSNEENPAPVDAGARALEEMLEPLETEEVPAPVVAKKRRGRKVWTKKATGILDSKDTTTQVCQALLDHNYCSSSTGKKFKRKLQVTWMD